MTSSRNELVSYLDNWQEPLKPSDLADALGLSLATVRVYKSRMDIDPVSHKNLLPQPLPKRGKRVLYTKSSIIDWWLAGSESMPTIKRGRPTKEQQLAKLGADYAQ